MKSHINQNTEHSVEEINFEKLYDTLVDLHKERTEAFIELWGYNEWEKTYLFPNYDYEYFDRMDELYAEQEEYENVDDENEYNSDYY